MCKNNDKFYLQDRFNAKYRIITDNIQTVSTIYNHKNTEISFKNFIIDFLRIDILDENIEEINNIIRKTKSSF